MHRFSDTSIILLFCLVFAAALPPGAALHAQEREPERPGEPERAGEPARLAEIDRLTEESLRLHTIDAEDGVRLGAEALRLATADADTLRILQAYQALGANYWILGKYDRSAHYYMDALSFAQRLGNTREIGRGLSNMGLLCRNIGMTARAEAYLREAVRLRTELPDSAGLAKSLLNFGLLLFETGRGDSSRIVHQRGLILTRQIGDTLDEARNLHYLARIARTQGETTSALALIDTALALFTVLGDRNGLTLARTERADILLRMGKPSPAREAAATAMKEALTLGSPFAIREASLVLAHASAALGDYRGAYAYQSIGREMDDSLKIQQAAYRLALMSIEKELAEQEQQWKFRERERQVQHDSQRRAEAVVRNGLLAGTLLLGILLIVVVVAYRGKQRSATLIEQQNARIERTNQELALEIESRERMLGIIGHDLLGPLGSITGMLELANQPDSGISETDRAELLDAAQQTAQGSTELLGRLLDWARSQKKDLVLSRVEGDFMQIVRSVTSLVQSRAQMKKIRLEVSGPPKLMLHFDPRVMTVVLENLLSNAVKFTRENGRVDIEVSHTDEQCIVRVTDTGIGMRPDVLARIREGRAVASERGSAMEAGHGLGLEMCRRLVLLHEGRLDVTSVEGKGSTFTVEIPCRCLREMD